MKKANIHFFDVEELACAITGLDYDAIDADTEIIEDKLIEEFDLSLDNFHEIIARLMPLIDVAKSPISGKTYQGFAQKENHSWIAKMEVNAEPEKEEKL